MKTFLLILVVLFVGLVISYVYFFQDTTLHKLPSQEKITPSRASSTINFRKIAHVAIIMMENRSFGQLVNNPDAPYINSLIQENSYAVHYYAITHPSLPNYLSIIGGSTFGITSDCTLCHVQSYNLIDQIEKAHKTWKAYMESIPSTCFGGSTSLYAQKHDPFIYFDDIRNNHTSCNNIVSLKELRSNLDSANTAPDFIWITPNICHDMHNCSTRTGDKWLSGEVPQIINSPAFTKNPSLLIITWDEADGSNTNHILTIFVGSAVKKNTAINTSLSHYSITHTIEEIWGLPSLTKSVEESGSFASILQ